MSTQQMISYRILLRKEPECGYTITVPSLPGCVTYGKSIEEAIEMAKEAIELYLESLKLHNEEYLLRRCYDENLAPSFFS